MPTERNKEIVRMVHDQMWLYQQGRTPEGLNDANDLIEGLLGIVLAFLRIAMETTREDVKAELAEHVDDIWNYPLADAIADARALHQQ